MCEESRALMVLLYLGGVTFLLSKSTEVQTVELTRKLYASQDTTLKLSPFIILLID